MDSDASSPVFRVPSRAKVRKKKSEHFFFSTMARQLTSDEIPPVSRILCIHPKIYHSAKSREKWAEKAFWKHVPSQRAAGLITAGADFDSGEC